ncbi:leukocyte receptor cluster lrc member 1 [Holotrichia oblita]|uniref:Leukocyte receptor cluster lrc member 1 n=1 Tax=Holotrichia oblita TaxID=644536 RepID=A0ACB9TXU2_HOLOL|nr:leukocyte receptor cluster lrc member 1 [Holotrichia oblita]
MNILPKKRWHVRNKDNIARVRRDEAKAAEEERLKQERTKLAEQEARTELLRQRARERLKTDDFVSLSSDGGNISINTEDGHVNFFKDLEDETDECKKTNAEHDKEKKEEQEQYEKKIGYLTYLGQDTNEALGKQSWYNIAPNRSNKDDDEEINLKTKTDLDPLSIMKKFMEKPNTTKTKSNDNVGISVLQSMREKEIISLNYKEDNKKSSKRRRDSDSNFAKKHKKRKHKHNDTSESESESDLEKIEKQKKLELLRSERLKREREERLRVEQLFSKQNKNNSNAINNVNISVKQKYNSQFNPELAKQNYKD